MHARSTAAVTLPRGATEAETIVLATAAHGLVLRGVGHVGNALVSGLAAGPSTTNQAGRFYQMHMRCVSKGLVTLNPFWKLLMNPYDALAQHWVARHGTSALDPLVGSRWNTHQARNPALQALPAWVDDGSTAPLSEETLRLLASQRLTPSETQRLSGRLEEAVAENDLGEMRMFLAQNPAEPDDLELFGMGRLAAAEGSWRLQCHGVSLVLHLQLVGEDLQVRVAPGERAWSSLMVVVYGEDAVGSVELTPDGLAGEAHVGLGGVVGVEMSLYRLRRQRGAWRSLVAAALQPRELMPQRIE